MSKRLVKVTREHILQAVDNFAAKKPRCTSCAVWLALRDEFGRDDFEVFGMMVQVEIGRRFRFGWLPREARSFIQRFDAMEPVEPFEFAISERLFV